MRTNPSSPDREHLVRRVFQALVVGLFALQIAAFVTAKTTSHRYFCWAPFDQHTSYEIHASRHGVPLSDEAIEARYHIPARGYNPRSCYEVLGTIERFESTDGRHRPLEVHVSYRINGGPEQTWTRTPPKP